MRELTITTLAGPVSAGPAQPHADLIARCIDSSLSGLAPNTRRCYGSRIAAYLEREPDELSRESVKRYLRSLESAGATAQVLNQTAAALKRLAGEAAELGWIGQQQATQIERIKTRRERGIRTGKWLTAEQAAALMLSVDRSTTRGRRDACVLALLLGCGLRRAEACSLETAQCVRHNGRLLLVNLAGKGNKKRTVAVPEWAAADIEDWLKELESAQCRHS